MGKLHQKQAAEANKLAKALKQKRGGIAHARRALEKTTLALLRDEVNRARIAPAHAANTARREAAQPMLFERI